MTRALLVRHALCDPVGHWIAGRTPGVHLNDEGRAQAHALAQRLAATALDAVYTGPLERVRETAAAIAAPHGLEPVIEPAFTEIDTGGWTGRSFDDLADDPHRREYNTLRSLTPPPEGEPFLDVQARAVATLMRCATRHQGRTFVIVSHADVIRAIIVHLLGIPADLLLRLRIDPASVTAFHFNGRWPELQYLNVT